LPADRRRLFPFCALSLVGDQFPPDIRAAGSDCLVFSLLVLLERVGDRLQGTLSPAGARHQRDHLDHRDLLTGRGKLRDCLSPPGANFRLLPGLYGDWTFALANLSAIRSENSRAAASASNGSTTGTRKRRFVKISACATENAAIIHS